MRRMAGKLPGSIRRNGSRRSGASLSRNIPNNLVAAWPDIQRELTALLPLLSRMQPLFAMLVQVLPLLAGPQALGRAIGSGGAALLGALEQALAACTPAAESPADEAPADYPA